MWWKERVHETNGKNRYKSTANRFWIRRTSSCQTESKFPEFVFLFYFHSKWIRIRLHVVLFAIAWRLWHSIHCQFVFNILNIKFNHSNSEPNKLHTILFDANEIGALTVKQLNGRYKISALMIVAHGFSIIYDFSHFKYICHDHQLYTFIAPWNRWINENGLLSNS